MLQLWFDGYDWYIAESADEAKKLQIELTGEDEYRDADNEFRLVDPDSRLTLGDENGHVTKKVRNWIDGRTKGFFASTES